MPLSYYRSHTLAESKQCMFISLKPETDFSRECAGQRTVHPFLMTRPLPSIRELGEFHVAQLQRFT
jgi:hypothetical protein